MGEINTHTSDTSSSRSCDIKDNSVELWFKDSLRDYSPISSHKSNDSFNEESCILKEMIEEKPKSNTINLKKVGQSKLDMYKSKIYGIFGYQRNNSSYTKESLINSGSLKSSLQLGLKEKTLLNSKGNLTNFGRNATELLWSKAKNSFLKPGYRLKKQSDTITLKIDNYITSLNKHFKQKPECSHANRHPII